MNTLEIFLKSLNKFRSDGLFYVSRYIISPTKIKCVETHLIEIYLVNYTKCKELVLDFKKNYNIEEISPDEIKDELYTEVITKILKHYNLYI